MKFNDRISLIPAYINTRIHLLMTCLMGEKDPDFRLMLEIQLEGLVVGTDEEYLPLC